MFTCVLDHADRKLSWHFLTTKEGKKRGNYNMCSRNYLHCFAKTWIYLTPYVRMYWTHFWQQTVHVQQNIFEKVVSSHIYASFGRFCVQIGQLLEAQWNFKLFLWKQRFYRFQTFFKESKGAKRSVKMWATNFYQSFSKIFCCKWMVGCLKFVQYIRME